MPTATTTLAPTETQAPSITSEPTLEMMATTTPKIRIVRDVLSPDRRWQATVIRQFVDDEERSIFRVQNDYGRVEWVVEDVPFEDVLVRDFPFPEPFYWSKNGRYLYYTYQRSGDGCFAGDRHQGEGLYRLDLATGETLELSPNYGSWMVLSPDESTLDYFFYARQGLTLRDLKSGHERTLAQIVLQADGGMELDQRYIVWAPDSQSLLFVVMAGVCDFEPESYYNWLVQVDVSTGTQKVLFEKDERGFIPVSWPEPDKVLLRDGEGQMWWLNPTTEGIEPIP